ncbi:sensor histidine kinase [Consotaella aegiceratis]|uniref:sensor histidine kinase n=1 Tax=Consotaella aegiceratis TaxID=3097961 RepID=UPI002F42E3DE
MSGPSNPAFIANRLKAAEAIGVACGILVVAISGAVLVGGWLVGSVNLTRLHADWAAMAPSTSLCFLFTGAAILIGTRSPGTRNDCWLMALSAGIWTVVLCAVILPQIGVQIIGLLLGRHVITDARMSPATALCFQLAAISIFSLSFRSRISGQIMVAAASIGVLLSTIAVVGYVFSVRALYSVWIFKAMALHTALVFLVAFSGLLCLRPDVGWPAVLLGPGQGSDSARRLLPLMIVVPMGLCFAAYRLVDAGLAEGGFMLSVVGVSVAVLLGASVLYNATLVNDQAARLAVTQHQLQISLRDRELLLREVNHRVKNNLAQIHSMLRLQGRRANDTVTREALADAARRVIALGTLHKILLANDSPSKLSAKEYIEKLCGSIDESLPIKERGIAVRLDLEDVGIGMDQAIALGMILNELLTNAVKHAFPEGNGEILIKVGATEGGWHHLAVTDNGKGFDPSLAMSGSNAGMKIIRSMVAQMRGQMSVESRHGARFDILFPSERS